MWRESMKKFISALVAGAMLAVAAAPALAGLGGPGPGPGWGPGPGPRWHAAPPPPPRGGWGWGHRYWGPGDWILPFGVGVGLLALAATPSHTTSTVPAAPVQTQPAPPVNVTINNTPASSSVATQDYFYCPAQKGYYPTIPSCPTGWIKSRLRADPSVGIASGAPVQSRTGAFLLAFSSDAASSARGIPALRKACLQADASFSKFQAAFAGDVDGRLIKAISGRSAIS